MRKKVHGFRLYLFLGLLPWLVACGGSEGDNTSNDEKPTNETDSEIDIYDEETNERPMEDGERNSEEAYKIVDSKADKVAIMMPMETVREAYPEDQILDISNLAGDEAAKLRIFDPEQFSMMEVDFDCSMPDCPAVSISVVDDRFRTEAGLGVGSTWGEIKQVYPLSEIEVWEDALGTVFLEPVDKAHVFVMDLAGVPDSFAVEGLEALPLELPVVEVLIY